MFHDDQAERLVAYLDEFTAGMMTKTFEEHGKELFGDATHFFTMAESLRAIIENLPEEDVPKAFMSNFVAALRVAHEMGRRTLLQ